MANIIITNISRLRIGARFRNYRTDDMGTIKGRYTNEAPVKYLLDTVYKSKSEMNCRIIAITTDEAKEALTAFKKTLRRYCKKNNYTDLTIDNVAFNGNFSTVIAEIVDKMNKGDRIYIDTTGGFRDSVYLLMAVVRILEFSGINLERAIYSVYNEKRPKDNHIVDITDTYKMFNLINAANSFASWGSSDELADYFSECSNNDIKRAIDVLNRFSDEVALCRTSKLDSLMAELNDILISIRNLSSDVDSEILFKSISGVIREKFGARNSESIDYIDVIKWCLDNKMIQQAVTIYVEKMPEYIFSKGLISFRSDNLDMTKFNKNFDKYYNMLYNGFLQQLTSMTYSPYPLSNLLLKLRKEKTVAYREVCNISSINDFSLKDSLTSDERRGLINLIRVKNVLFSDNNARRTSEEIEKRRQNTKLRDFAESELFKSNAYTTEAFVNEVLKSEKYISLLQGEFAPLTPKVWNMADINVVEHLERVLKENNNMYTVNSKIKLDDMRDILRRLIYVKRYIRNSLNHAREDNCLADEFDEYFSSIGYNVSEELSVKEIESVIRDAINQIQSLTN